MPLLKIIGTGKTSMVLVSGVPMPDGTKRTYCEVGRDALAHIYERILLDKAFIRELVRSISRRLLA